MRGKAIWFLAIFLVVLGATSVLLAILEPGHTNSAELGRAVGRLIIPDLLVTTALYFCAKRLGWIRARAVQRHD